MRKAILSVTNDIYTDQRVNKMARTLHSMGYTLTIIGVRRKNSPPFSPNYARIQRISLMFHKGFLFYAEYNLKLFILLLSRRFHLLVSNDLDTLLPCHLAAWLKNKPLVYDAHEYFTATPEVMHRPLVRWVWKKLERILFPRQNSIITVNDSIATLYEKDYGKRPEVVRNLPLYRSPKPGLSRELLGLPEDKHLVLLQGTGINTDRGAEELVEAMHPRHGVNNTLLLIIGGGDVIPSIKIMIKKMDLNQRVWVLDKMPYEQLYAYTQCASIGVSLDKDTNLNYRYSLPNKIFDYMMAGTPQLVSDLPEVAAIIRHHQTGRVIQNHQPAHIAGCLSEMLADKQELKRMSTNCLQAAQTYCWENEEEVIRKIYRPFLG